MNAIQMWVRASLLILVLSWAATIAAPAESWLVILPGIVGALAPPAGMVLSIIDLVKKYETAWPIVVLMISEAALMTWFLGLGLMAVGAP
jgi:hypothetical protein